MAAPVTGARRAIGALTRRNPLLAIHDSLAQCLAPALSRSMATETAPTIEARAYPRGPIVDAASRSIGRQVPVAQVMATVYNFPSLEPVRFVHYDENQLQLPLRRDILHRAVIYEGDNTRQGTASTKTRGEVHGSGRKIRPQKGTGKARLGNRKSPMLKGGGVAHGPHPRDFSTHLPRKIYDLAWRTALSYRYKCGDLLILEDKLDVDEIGLADAARLGQILGKLQLGRSDGGSMFVLAENDPRQIAAFSSLGLNGRMKTEDDVDVKDLLTKSKLVIQKGVLDRILESHSSDLYREAPGAVYY